MVKKPEQPDNLVITKVKCAMHVILCNFTKFYAKNALWIAHMADLITSKAMNLHINGQVISWAFHVMMQYYHLFSCIFFIISLEFKFWRSASEKWTYQCISWISQLFHASKAGFSCSSWAGLFFVFFLII